MNLLHLLRWALALSIVLTMLACSFLQGPAVEISPSAVPEDASQPDPATEVSQDQTPVDESTPDEPTPLDEMLDLRSIQFNLTTSYPDETSNSIQAEIDAVGNMHLKFANPSPTDTAEDLKAPALPTTFDIYVVDGTVYRLNGMDDAWTADPEPADYHARLAEQLHGMDGPGFWLDLLPEGSLQSAGEETVGGFTTEKVMVNGLVADQTITGSLWFDAESHALVQVELHVPAALLSASEGSTPGELKIILEAQKADIPEIAVPN